MKLAYKSMCGTQLIDFSFFVDVCYMDMVQYCMYVFKELNCNCDRVNA